MSLEDLSVELTGAEGPATLSARSGVDEDHLVLLRRDAAVIDALADVGSSGSRQLHDAAPDAKAEAELAGELG